jgi:hypothetical protein
MKFIISEKQSELLSEEKIADIIFRVIKNFYPDMFEEYKEKVNHINYYDSEDKNELLFFIDDDNDLKVSFNLINDLYEKYGVPFFEPNSIRLQISKERFEFNRVMRLMFKKHFGKTTDNVFFHYYY